MEWEFNILYWFQSIHNPVLDAISVFLSYAGDGPCLVFMMLCMLILLKNKRPGITIFLALNLSLLFCNIILKNAIHRDRPCWIDESVALLVSTPKDYSFPSGHSSASFAFAVALLQYYRGWGIFALVMAFFVGLSRLYLFVHFPTDVLVGALCGITAGLLSGVLLKKLYEVRNKFGKIEKR